MRAEVVKKINFGIYLNKSVEREREKEQKSQRVWSRRNCSFSPDEKKRIHEGVIKRERERERKKRVPAVVAEELWI